MNKITISLLLAILAVITGAYIVRIHPDIRDTFAPSGLLPILHREVSAPPPLIGPLARKDDVELTTQGVFLHTNAMREEHSVDPLSSNTLLDRAAEIKIQDMSENQYFDHVSPDGKGPADVVDATGYTYMRVGENLAMGYFASDEDLVQAWMDSPGHRENILEKRFTQLGVAVQKVTYDGREIWMAVQMFGTPASACTQPSTSLKESLEEMDSDREHTKTRLDAKKQQIDTLQAESSELITKQQRLIDEGNRKVREGNESIQRGNEIYQETGSREEAQPYWDRGEELQEEGSALIDEAQALTQEIQSNHQHIRELQTEYNTLANRVNNHARERSEIAKEYNTQVQAFNTCLEQYKAD